MSDQARAVIDKLIEGLGGEFAVNVLQEAGVLVLMPMPVSQVPEGSWVHLPPPTVSLNWCLPLIRQRKQQGLRQCVGGKAMKRLLHFVFFLLGMSLFGIGVNINSGVVAEPALKQELASQPVPSESAPTTTTVADLATTTTAAPAPRMSSTAPRRSRVQVSTTAPKQQSTTTTTEARRPHLRSHSPRSARPARTPRAGSGARSSPHGSLSRPRSKAGNRAIPRLDLHTIAKDQGRLTDRHVSATWCSSTSGKEQRQRLHHSRRHRRVGGRKHLHTIEGNADDSGLVTRQVRELGDGYVIDFAPFEKELQ